MTHRNRLSLWSVAGTLAVMLSGLILLRPLKEQTRTPNNSLSEATPSVYSEFDSTATRVLSALESNDPTRQREGLRDLLGRKSSVSWAIPAIERLINRCDGRTDDRLVASSLTVLRREGKSAGTSRNMLVALMAERAPLYDQRDKYETVRLRAYVLLTLADTGNADAAIPYIHDYLTNAEEFGPGFEAGAGARAAGMLGPGGREFLDELVVLFARSFNDPNFSLERYESDFPDRECTTVQREILRAFQRIGFADAENVHRLLEACAANKSRQAQDDFHIVREAKIALHNSSPIAPHPPQETSFELGFQRVFVDVANALRVNYVDQDGNCGVLSDLIDRPTVLVFFYTRCTNSNKCSATVTRLAQLQQSLEKETLAQSVRLIGVTYEPKLDDPQRLKTYGDSRNVRFDASTRFVQLDPNRHEGLMSAMEVPVSYNNGWVSVHRVTLLLIDGEQHLVGRFDIAEWSNERLIDELQRVLLPTEAAK
jgi:protein SCO1/2